MWLRSLLQSSATLSLYIWCFFSKPCYTVFYIQCVFTACYSALLQRAISSPWETGGRLFRLPQGFPAAAARLSPVSLSVDAARQPSAFIAHLAHARFDIYMADSACKHTGTCLDGGLSSQPLRCQPVTRQVSPPLQELNLKNRIFLLFFWIQSEHKQQNLTITDTFFFHQLNKERDCDCVTVDAAGFNRPTSNTDHEDPVEFGQTHAGKSSF